MRPETWQLTDDLDDFLARAGGFLRSRPAPHTVPLTVTDTLREHGLHYYGRGAPSSAPSRRRTARCSRH